MTALEMVVLCLIGGTILAKALVVSRTLEHKKRLRRAFMGLKAARLRLRASKAEHDQIKSNLAKMKQKIEDLEYRISQRQKELGEEQEARQRRAKQVRMAQDRLKRARRKDDQR